MKLILSRRGKASVYERALSYLFIYSFFCLPIRCSTCFALLDMVLFDFCQERSFIWLTLTFCLLSNCYPF